MNQFEEDVKMGRNYCLVIFAEEIGHDTSVIFK